MAARERTVPELEDDDWLKYDYPRDDQEEYMSYQAAAGQLSGEPGATADTELSPGVDAYPPPDGLKHDTEAVPVMPPADFDSVTGPVGDPQDIMDSVASEVPTHQFEKGKQPTQKEVDAEKELEAGGMEHHSSVKGYFALAWMLISLLVGCSLQVLQERLLHRIPYTCLLFLTGVIMAAVNMFRPPTNWTYWPTWYISVQVWEVVDPHLIFYTFLPALIFAEAMKLNIKMARDVAGQVQEARRHAIQAEADALLDLVVAVAGDGPQRTQEETCADLALHDVTRHDAVLEHNGLRLLHGTAATAETAE